MSITKDPKIWALYPSQKKKTRPVPHESLSIKLSRNVLQDLQSGSFPVEIRLRRDVSGSAEWRHFTKPGSRKEN